MKSRTLLTSFLTLSILAPVVAMGAVNCELNAKDSQLTTAQRTAYTRQCLAETSAAANVKRVAELQKKLSCEQNAKNKALQGNARTDYVAQCVNQNDARDAAVAMAATKKGASLARDYSANEDVARVH